MQEEPKQETLEEAAEKHYEEQSREFENNTDNPIFDTSRYLVAGFIEGAKWQAERMYSEGQSDYLIEALKEIESFCDNQNPTHENIWRVANNAIEQFKKK
jgi:hypothetical protein